MGRQIRVFKSSELAEITMRVSEGLPFIPTATIKLLIRSAMSRSNREQRVVITHFLWHLNHCHLMFIIKDAHQAVKFYMELRRKISEYIKRLTGRRQLKLWEERPSIISFPTLRAAIERIAYIYSNPAKDNLVETITDYPGYSSYQYFVTAFDKSVNYKIQERAQYIPFDAVDTVGTLASSEVLGVALANKLRKRARCIGHMLEVSPNAWIDCYKEELQQLSVKEINQMILDSLNVREENARKIREDQDATVIGRVALLAQRFMREYTPRIKERRIYVICDNKEIRILFIQKIKEITAYCKDLFKAACRGAHNTWPPGTFKPPIPPLANAIAW